MTHPIHAILGNVLLVVLCGLLSTLILFVAFHAFKGLFLSLFGYAEDAPDVLTEEQKILHALPIGAPAGNGNYIYTGQGWERLNDEQAAEVRQNLKYAARAKMEDADGWRYVDLVPETAVHHSEHTLELLNDIDGDYDGPDDLPDDDEVERPDEKQVIGFRE